MVVFGKLELGQPTAMMNLCFVLTGSVYSHKAQPCTEQVFDECTELPLPQKRRTQFLSSNYVGEIAVMPGAWGLAGSNENVAGDVLMYLADPKPDVQKTTTSDSAENDEKKRTENKQRAFDKEVDERDANRFGDDEKGVSQVRHK